MLTVTLPDDTIETESGTRNDDGDEPEAAWLGGWLALTILFLLLVTGWRWQELMPTQVRLAGVLAWLVVAIAFLLTRRVAIVVIYAIALGFLLRWADFYAIQGSDVASAVDEWLRTLLAGENPYSHFFTTTIPPGTPIGYPPIQFLVHAPGVLAAGIEGARFTEVALAVGVMGGFAWLGAKWGWAMALPAMALYAALPNLVNVSLDGSNDTATGAILFLAVLTVAWAEGRGFPPGATTVAGVAAALALGMKQTALFVVVALVVWIWHRAGRQVFRRYVLSMLLVLAVVSLPFVLWDIGAYLSALVSAPGFHTEVWGWNVWALAASLGWPIPEHGTTLLVNAAVSVAVVVVFLLVPLRRLSTAVIVGVIGTLIVLVTARWTSYAYFPMLAPVALLIPILIASEWEGPSTSPGPATR